MSKLQEECLAHYGVPGMEWDESKKKKGIYTPDRTGPNGKNAQRRLMNEQRRLESIESREPNVSVAKVGSKGQYNSRMESARRSNAVEAVVSRNHIIDTKRAIAKKESEIRSKKDANKAKRAKKLDEALSTPVRDVKNSDRKQKLKQKLDNAMDTPLPTAKIKARGEANKKRLENSLGTPSATEKKTPNKVSRDYLEERAANRKKNKY